jgi:ribose/xylose/arabinose/galactoside ABC-type transport system permease subunit
VAESRTTSQSEGASATRRGPDWFTAISPYLGLILIIGIFSAFTARWGRLHLFLSVENVRLITLHAAVIATVAVGMTIIMISGGIDLSVGFVVSLVTVLTVLVYNITGYRLMHWFGWGKADPGLALLASIPAIGTGLLTGAVVGLGNSLVINRLRVVPFVATLGMMGVARGLSQLITRGTPLPFLDPVEPPAWVPFLAQLDPDPSWLLVSPSVWSVVLLALVAAVVLRSTVLGRYCYAIGSNEATARLCGIPVARTKILIYVLAGLATGWAGVIQTARSGAGLFDVGAGLELEVIAAVVIGGASLSGGEGTISGTLIGALVLAVLDNGCSKLNLPNEFRFMVIGLIIIGVAALNSARSQNRRS